VAKMRVAVIGRTGKGNYGHGLDTVWRELDDVEVVAVADENEQGRAEAAGRIGAPRAYGDYREMLGREKPQIVAVGPRWLDCHREMVIACAQHGASVFLEKPICPSLEDADAMIAACEQRHVKCAIAHQTRYSPRVARARELIQSGALGQVLEARGRGKEDRRGGGEDLMVLGTHIMDLMRFLLGSPTWCSSQVFDGGKRVTRETVRTGAEGMAYMAGDTVDATYGFPHGVTGYFSSHRPQTPTGARFGLRILGTKGMLDLTTGGLGQVHFCEDPNWGAGGTSKPWVLVSSEGLGKPEPLQDGGLGMGNVAIAKDLIRAIATDTQPLGSIYDGRAALEMILAVYESHRVSAPVALPLQNRKHPLSML